MTTETSIQAVESITEELLKGTPDIFLVSVKIKPTNNIKIFLDADSGLSIEKCVKINRALYKVIEEKQWYPDGNFSLEVSSPGIEEPLKLLRQYKKNIGRKVEVLLQDDTRQQGKLTAASDQEIKLEQTEGKGKKQIIKEIEIPFADIKQVKVLVVF